MVSDHTTSVQISHKKAQRIIPMLKFLGADGGGGISNTYYGLHRQGTPIVILREEYGPAICHSWFFVDPGYAP